MSNQASIKSQIYFLCGEAGWKFYEGFSWSKRQSLEKINEAFVEGFKKLELNENLIESAKLISEENSLRSIREEWGSDEPNLEPSLLQDKYKDLEVLCNLLSATVYDEQWGERRKATPDDSEWIEEIALATVREVWWQALCEREFQTWWNPNKFNWKQHSEELCKYTPNQFEIWWDAELFYSSKSSNKPALSWYCSDHFKTWWDPKQFEWEFQKHELCTRYAEHFDLWWDKDKMYGVKDLDSNCFGLLSEFHPDKFSTWFENDKTNYHEHSKALAERHMDYFDLWWDADLFNWSEGSAALAEHGADRFDDWFNARLFHYESGSENLAKFCGETFYTWWSFTNFNWETGSVALINHQLDKLPFWWDKYRFNWKTGSEYLAQNAMELFEVWWCPSRFGWESGSHALAQNGVDLFELWWDKEFFCFEASEYGDFTSSTACHELMKNLAHRVTDWWDDQKIDLSESPDGDENWIVLSSQWNSFPKGWSEDLLQRNVNAKYRLMEHYDFPEIYNADFNWKYAHLLLNHYPDSFDLWWNASKYDYSHLEVLVESEPLSRWYDPENFDKSRTNELLRLLVANTWKFEDEDLALRDLSDFFRICWDANTIDWEASSVLLAQYCAESFDVWWAPERFNWQGASWALAEFCSAHFDTWYDAKKINYDWVSLINNEPKLTSLIFLENLGSKKNAWMTASWCEQFKELFPIFQNPDLERAYLLAQTPSECTEHLSPYNEPKVPDIVQDKEAMPLMAEVQARFVEEEVRYLFGNDSWESLQAIAREDKTPLSSIQHKLKQYLLATELNEDFVSDVCYSGLFKNAVEQALLIKSYEVDAEQEEWMFSETEFEYELYELFLKLSPLVDLSESSFSEKNRATTKERIIDCVIKSWCAYF